MKATLSVEAQRIELNAWFSGLSLFVELYSMLNGTLFHAPVKANGRPLDARTITAAPNAVGCFLDPFAAPLDPFTAPAIRSEPTIQRPAQ